MRDTVTNSITTGIIIIMATKRAWESENAPTAQELSPFARPSHPKRSRHNFADPELPASDAASRLSISRLKKKIRDTTRMLDHSDKLPADVRIEKERALVGYQHDLEQAASKKRRQEMIKKYHMVRFFGQFPAKHPAHSDDMLHTDS